MRLDRPTALPALFMLWLSACGSETGERAAADLRPASFSELQGWSSDNQSEALVAFRQSCPKLVTRDMVLRTERGESTVTAAAWHEICAAAARVPSRNPPAARAFFETHFRPVAFASEARYTGYFEPELRGSRAPSRQYTVPVYRRPGDLGTGPYLTRAEIENGGLRGKALEIAYVGDPIGLFELHVQGSGRVLLTEGGVLRLGFDGSNNRPYTALAKVLADEGVMPRDQANWPRIRQWLQDNPARARDLMRRNERYIFFRDMQGQGPLGAQGVSLLAQRSLAVDPAYTPYGLPAWVETQRPIVGKPGSESYRRLLVAQDTGTAIRGPARGDIFFGAGTNAAELAGRLNSTGRFWMLVPNR